MSKDDCISGAKIEVDGGRKANTSDDAKSSLRMKDIEEEGKRKKTEEEGKRKKTEE